MSCIIVLGCYRSGTSAVAGILQRLGVFMGSEFDNPSKANPTGYFEDLEFKRLFDKMAEGYDAEHQLDVLMRIRDMEKPVWGFKDPQTCLFMHRIIPLIKTDIKIIAMMRPREEICESLSRAMPELAKKPEEWIPLVYQHTKKMNEFLHDYNGPVLHMEWEDLKKNSAHEVKRIADFVGLPMTNEVLNIIC